MFIFVYYITCLTKTQGFAPAEHLLLRYNQRQMQ